MAPPQGSLRHLKSLRVLYHVGSNLYREPGGEALARKVVIVASSVIFTLLTGGIIFGFSSIEDILVVKEGAYASLCQEGESFPCKAQLAQVTFTVTVATSAVSLSALPVGVFLDAFGPRVTACVASLIFASGLMALALAKSLSESLYIYGFVALAAAGPAIATSMSNFSDLFGEKASGIISVQSGAFQVSSVVMVAWAAAVSKFGVSLSRICGFYVVVPAAIFVTSLLLFPDKAYGTGEGPGQRGEPHRVWLIRRILVARENSAAEKPSLEPSSSLEPEDHVEDQGPLLVPMLSPEDSVPKPPELYNTDIWQQVRSLPFLVVSIFVGYFILVINFYVATVHDQLLKEAAVEEGAQSAAAFQLAAYYTSLFSLMLSIGGAVGIPLLGSVLVKFGLPTAFVCQGIIALVFLLSQIPGLIPLRLKVIGFFALGLNRPVGFGSFMAYLAEIFGFRNFGKLYGLAQLAGSAVAPIQFLLPILVRDHFQGSYFWVNLSLAVGQTIIMFSVPYYIMKHIFSGFFFRPKLPSRLVSMQGGIP